MPPTTIGLEVSEDELRYIHACVGSISQYNVEQIAKVKLATGYNGVLYNVLGSAIQEL